VTSPMTPRDFAEAMLAIVREHSGDSEAQHGWADELMETLLRSLGYEEEITIFEGMRKWYA